MIEKWDFGWCLTGEKIKMSFAPTVALQLARWDQENFGNTTFATSIQGSTEPNSNNDVLDLESSSEFENEG